MFVQFVLYKQLTIVTCVVLVLREAYYRPLEVIAVCFLSTNCFIIFFLYCSGKNLSSKSLISIENEVRVNNENIFTPTYVPL